MARSIVGVVVGYLTMFVLVFVSFTCAYLAMGADRAFKPGAYDPSTLWVVISFVLGTIAAVAGGLVCGVISRSRTAGISLAVVVLVLGGVFAIPAFTKAETPPEVRTGDVKNLDAMMKARTPAWLHVVNPIIGAVGVLLGSNLGRPRTAPKL